MEYEDIAKAVLQFWFEHDVVPGLCEFRPVWFESTPGFDAEISDRFLAVYERAVAGELDELARTARGCLALVIILDQFPRNMFRDSARAYASDAKARSVARPAIERGVCERLASLQRMFLYTPFQHSEKLEDQRWSEKLFESLGDEPALHWIQSAARRHCEIIERFGRFPHRNEALRRENTRDEREFLESPSGRFWLT